MEFRVYLSCRAGQQNRCTHFEMSRAVDWRNSAPTAQKSSMTVEIDGKALRAGPLFMGRIGTASSQASTFTFDAPTSVDLEYLSIDKSLSVDSADSSGRKSRRWKDKPCFGLSGVIWTETLQNQLVGTDRPCRSFWLWFTY